MVDQSDITFVCHTRLESPLRYTNLKTIYNYYTKHLPGAKFVIIEDDNASKIVSDNVIRPRKGDQFLLFKNDGNYNKCKGYNIGAKKAQTKYLIFLDIDIIVHTEYLMETVNNSVDVCIGYNGTALYMNEEGRKDFIQSLDIEDLWKTLLYSEFKTSMQTKHFLVGNTEAVGGCLIVKKDIFMDLNGFNPNFTGWGYEDNEIISRATILGYSVSRSDIKDNYLFHLPHEVNPNRDKSNHPSYFRNKAEIDRVEGMDKDKLQQYIKSWTV